MDDSSLYQSLVELNLIAKSKLDKASKISQQVNLPLEQILLEKNLINDEDLGKLKADFYNCPFIKLSDQSIAEQTLKLIPEIVAKKQKIIAFKQDKNGLHLAMADPSQIQIRDFVAKKMGVNIIVYLATKQDIHEALNLYNKNIKDVFDTIIAENIVQTKVDGQSDPPIIKIVDTVIKYAYQNKASDIHIELQSDHCLVRFRIDGILHDIITLPKELHLQIITRIKVMAKLRTDEHQSAQDGKIHFQLETEELDLRVSVVPITKGEKTVLRLLSEHNRQLSLHDLGLNKNDQVLLKKGFTKPYGMILVTGPTGSGKTTTLYAVVKILNSRHINIMTIEDPVEYDIQGINQIQVNPKTNLTFATGLRSILRQDPNVVLVGEIRDQETAEIAVNAAMTGHLVLSTLHTNDATTSIPRLLDLGIEPFLIASTVNVIIGQRLVRKICKMCRVSYEPKVRELASLLTDKISIKYFNAQKFKRLYHGKGCKICHQTGYEGRVGIYEVLVLNDEIRQLILERPDNDTLKTLAIKHGMKTMFEEGLEKAKQGVTTLEEIIRVINT